MTAAAALAALLAAAAASPSAPAPAPPASPVPLPPICRDAPPADTTTSIADLRRRVESLAPGDPDAAIALLCSTIPRVARETGADSLETAWWVGSLATPLIAYKEAYADAVPLLEFARPIYERRLGPHAAEIADIHVAYGWMRYRQGRLAEARAAWESAVAVRERTPGAGKIELQKALVGLGQVAMMQRDFAAARAALERARAILVESGEAVSEAAAAIENVLTNIAMREENYAVARAHAEALIDIETKMGGATAQRVPSYALLGQILERLDEYEESERTLREAVRLAESKEGPLQRHLLSALTTLSGFLDERGRPEEALSFATRAVTFGVETLGPDAPRLVRALLNQADAHRALGELPEALRAYERAGAIVEAHPDDVERAVRVAYFRGRGLLEAALGDAEAARATLGRGLDAAGDDPTLSTDRAAVLVALASVPAAPGDPDPRERLTLALALYRARLPESHPLILRAIDALCGLEIDRDPDATPDCAEAARRLEAGREIEPALRAAVHGHLSLLLARRGDTAGAEAAALQALAAAEALGTPDPLWRARHRLARLLHDRGAAAMAVFFGKSSLASIEELRGRFVGDDRRFERGFLADKVAVYRSVADWLMEAGRIDEGLLVLRRLKDEELYDFTLRSEDAASAGLAADLTPAERELLDAYRRAVDADAAAGQELDRLSRLREAGRLSVREQEELEGRLAGQRRDEAARAGRLAGFLEERAGAAPAAGASPSAVARPAETAALAAEARRLGDDTVLAIYLTTPTHLRILVATRKGVTESRVAIDAGALGRDIGRFVDAIARRDDVRTAAEALYRTVALPVDEAARRAGASRLVLWLDGALRYLPFGALHDGRRWLAESYALERRTGSSGPDARPRAGRASAPQVRGLGVTRAVAGYRALPGVGDELCSVVDGPIAGLLTAGSGCARPGQGGGALAGEGFADGAFTRARFDTLLAGPRDFSVMHLGTHFSLRPGNALRSYLVLGDGSRLTLDTLDGLDFSGIDLVTLSACQTALGGAAAEDGREVDGFGALLARRGARRVIASLWEVEDAGTASLMGSMYRVLRAAPEDPARALQRAQASLRAVSRDGSRPWEHPYYWAGFVVTAAAPPDAARR